jgi:copper transport protein
MIRLVLMVGFVPVLLGMQGRLGSSDRRWRWIIPTELALGLALLLTPGLAGHASTGSQPVVGLSLDVAHLAAAAVWLGGLALLATFLVGRRKNSDQPVDPHRVTLRVSNYAFVAVVVVVATGTVQAIRQVGSLYALLHTVYGQTLLVKIALVVLFIGVGAASRRIVHGGWGLRRPDRSTRAAATDLPPTAPPGGRASANSPMRGRDSVPTTGPRQSSSARSALAVAERPVAPDSEPDAEFGMLRRTVLAEIAIALAVLAVTALLVNAVPAKQAADLPFSTSFTTLGVQVNAIVSPARAGAGNQVHVYVLSEQGTPKAIPELDASLSLPAQNLGPLSVPLVVGGPGHYYATNVDIPVAGMWALKITVRTDAIDEQVVSANLPVH